jgi:hypothetical protein
MPGRSSGLRRPLKVATVISRRCSTTIAACPCTATRCGRYCTISMVGPRTGRPRRRGFSDGRFPICSSVCCHRSTSCPCQGNVVRPSRQFIEGAGCPALNGCPISCTQCLPGQQRGVASETFAATSPRVIRYVGGALVQPRSEVFQECEEGKHYKPHTQRGLLPILSRYVDTCWKGCGITPVATEDTSAEK